MTRLRKIVTVVGLSAVAALATAAEVERGSGSERPSAVSRPATQSFSTARQARQLPPPPPVSLLAPAPLSESYLVLTRKSIFSRNHRASGSTEIMAPRPVSPESKLVFLGAMKEVDPSDHSLSLKPRLLASIEDTDSKKASWYSEGGKLSEGSLIREITLDHLIVEKNGARRRIELGGTMEGTMLGEAPSATASASSTPAATATSIPTGSESSIEEMMRRRRLQELEQR